MYRQMYELMGIMDGCTDGWMGGWMEGRIGKRMSRCIDERGKKGGCEGGKGKDLCLIRYVLSLMYRYTGRVPGKGGIWSM